MIWLDLCTENGRIISPAPRRAARASLTQSAQTGFKGVSSAGAGIHIAPITIIISTAPRQTLSVSINCLSLNIPKQFDNIYPCRLPAARRLQRERATLHSPNTKLRNLNRLLLVRFRKLDTLLLVRKQI